MPLNSIELFGRTVDRPDIRASFSHVQRRLDNNRSCCCVPCFCHVGGGKLFTLGRWDFAVPHEDSFGFPCILAVQIQAYAAIWKMVCEPDHHAISPFGRKFQSLAVLGLTFRCVRASLSRHIAYMRGFSFVCLSSWLCYIANILLPFQSTFLLHLPCLLTRTSVHIYCGSPPSLPGTI